MSAVEAALAALPGHSDEDRTVVEYLIGALTEAGWTLTPPSAGMALDDEGDCRACGHHPQVHGPSGCHERIHDAELNETTCDCGVQP